MDSFTTQRIEELKQFAQERQSGLPRDLEVCGLGIPKIEGEEDVLNSAENVATSFLEIMQGDDFCGGNSGLIRNAIAGASRVGPELTEKLVESVNDQFKQAGHDIELTTESALTGDEFVPAGPGFQTLMRMSTEERWAAERQYCKSLPSLEISLGAISNTTYQFKQDDQILYSNKAEAALPPFSDQEQWTEKRSAELKCDPPIMFQRK